MYPLRCLFSMVLGNTLRCRQERSNTGVGNAKEGLIYENKHALNSLFIN